MSEQTTGLWEARKIPHNYPDGTTHRWQVGFTSKDGLNVVLGDWLTEDTARLIACAPEMLAALKAAAEALLATIYGTGFDPETYDCPALDAAHAAIAKAEGR